MRDRRVFFLTGIRSEYDILAPVIAAVDATPATRAEVIVTGAHLSSEFGLSVRQIEADGFHIVDRIESLTPLDSLKGRLDGAGRQLLGLADLFERERPDFLVVMGDREESITGAMAATYFRVPLVHIGGGDHADDGNVDNLIRHAVTKLSHLHMTASQRSSERVRALGEEDWRIHTVGAPGLDRLLSTRHIDEADLMRNLEFSWDKKGYVIVLYHPTIVDFSEAGKNMKMILETTAEAGLPMIVLYPNTDPGNANIIDEITKFCALQTNARAYRYLTRELFVNLLRGAKALIGNSSAGILEAPSLNLPVVNIGLRQRGREHCENVIFVDYEKSQIRSAIQTAIFDVSFRAAVRDARNPYGDGKAGLRIAEILQATELNDRLLKKPFIN